MADNVHIDLPLSAKYASTVRAVSASIAAEVGFTVQDIDDLRLGVNEAVSVLTDVDPDDVDAAATRLHVRFEPGDDRLVVSAWRVGVADGDLEIDVLASRILTAVVDEFSIDDEGVFTLIKSVSVDAGA